MMNAETFEGKWNQLKGDVKTQWNRLTDEDMGQVKGKVDKLKGVIQKRYGIAESEANKQVDQFLKKH